MEHCLVYKELHQLAGAAVAQDHGLGGENNRGLSWFRRLEVEDPGVGSLVSSEASLLGWQTAAFCKGPHTVLPLCVHPQCLCVQISFSYKVINGIGSAPILTASCSPDRFFKGLISKYGHPLSHGWRG